MANVYMGRILPIKPCIHLFIPLIRTAFKIPLCWSAIGQPMGLSLGIALLLLMKLSTPVGAEPASSTAETNELCTFQNRVVQNDVILIGNIPDASYVVIIPYADEVAADGGISYGSTLETVRSCVPDAFLAHSRFGAYVQAGIFSSRRSAEQLARHLRSLNLSARVTYKP